MKTIHIGLFGAGTVGRGVIEMLRTQAETLEKRGGVRFNVKAVCDRSYRKKAEALKGINASDDPAIVLDDPEIEIVMELIGGIEPAHQYILAALDKGKAAVTANKALLAGHGPEIFARAQEKRVELGFEAAVAGALPVIQTLRRGLVVNDINAFYGILNGTCNFIITKMQDEGMDYADALKLAQDKGFAEADPSFDVGGNDAAQKLAILASLCYDAPVTEADVPTEGITDIRPVDLRLAESMGWVIRLLGVARKEESGELFLRVHPAMIAKNHVLASVVAEKNAIFFDTSHSGPSLLMGNGAGAHPTAAAAISDLIAIARNTSGEPEIWLAGTERPRFARDYNYRYYLRFQTVDQPGVLADIARELASHNISIATVHQEEGEEPVNMVVLTHTARESDLMNAIKTIDQLERVLEPTIIIRIEDHI